MSELQITELVAQIDRARIAGDAARVAELDAEILKITGGKPRQIAGEARITLPLPAGENAAHVEDFDEWDARFEGNGHPVHEAPSRMTLSVDELCYKWQRDGVTDVDTLDVDARLVRSISEKGIQNPLLVASRDRTYVWLGNQRLAVARLLGIPSVDCVVVSNSAEVEEALSSYEKA